MSHRVYLAGAVEIPGIEYARSWRDKAKALAEEFTDWQPVDPLDWEDLTATSFNDEQIYNTDRWLLDSCNAVLLDGRKPGWGTATELSWAHAAHKPVVVWGIERDKAPVFLRVQATIFELTLEDAVLRVAELSLE